MRGIIKLILIFIWLPLMIVVTTIPWLIRWEVGRRVCALITFKGVNLILNIRVKVKGKLSRQRPLMMVSNHCSYLDIMVLGSQLPIAFTPKKEIKSWPVIGYCCRLAGCVFVERTPKAVAKTKEEIAKRLKMGRVMCVFAEGTTNNGTDLLPFKSSFFSLAEMEGMELQPVALSYTYRDGERLGVEGRAEIAWFGDMTLLPHLWKVLNYRRIDAEVRLLKLIGHNAGDDRKILCAKSEKVIKEALISA